MNNHLSSIVKYILVIGSLGLISACTSQTDFKEGLHYQKLSPELTRQVDNDQIEVIELFFYGCPHCYELEPKIKAWVEKHADTISFQRIPAIVGPSWIAQAKAYYIAEHLGLLEKLHIAMFESIHKNGQQYYNDYAVMKFFLDQGVKEQAFAEASNSPVITEKLNQARIMTVKYNLRGVPAVIVNGKYKTAPFYNHNQEEMFEVLDMLIEQESTQTE